MKTRISIYIVVAILLNGLVSQAQPSPDHLFEDLRSRIGAVDPVQRSIVLSSGVELEYAEQGPVNGTPVIFLHGITDSWHSFEQVFSHLPEGMHAFALSQRGHGDSGRPSVGYEPGDFASDLADFIELRKLGRVVIVGHSMGGMIAQEFALNYPLMVSGIVIAGSAANFGEKEGIQEFQETVMRLQDPIGREFMDEFQKATLSRPIDPAFYDRLVNESTKVLLVRQNQFICEGPIESALKWKLFGNGDSLDLQYAAARIIRLTEEELILGVSQDNSVKLLTIFKH